MTHIRRRRPPWVLTLMRSANRNDYLTLLTPVEAAAILRIHEKTAIKLARTKRLPAMRLGKHWRFREQDLAAWIELQVQSSCQPDEPR